MGPQCAMHAEGPCNHGCRRWAELRWGRRRVRQPGGGIRICPKIIAGRGIVKLPGISTRGTAKSGVSTEADPMGRFWPELARIEILPCFRSFSTTNGGERFSDRQVSLSKDMGKTRGKQGRWLFRGEDIHKSGGGQESVAIRAISGPSGRLAMHFERLLGHSTIVWSGRGASRVEFCAKSLTGAVDESAPVCAAGLGKARRRAEFSKSK